MKVKIEGFISLDSFPELWLNDKLTLYWNGTKIPNINEVRYVKVRKGEVDRYYININEYLKHVIKWIKKAKAEKTGFDMFFSLWVAFNAFYMFYHEITEPENEIGEKKQVLKTTELLDGHDIEVFIQLYLPELNKIADTGFALPIKYRKQGRLIEEDIMPKLRELANKTGYSKEDMETILLGLYSIRNSLFHGKKQLIAQQDKLLRSAYNVLLPLLSLMLIKYLIRHR